MPKYGKIVHNKLILRIACGDAGPDENGNEYELTVGAGSNAPIVAHKKNGNQFILSWQDIIALAKEAGIDNEIKNS